MTRSFLFPLTLLTLISCNGKYYKFNENDILTNRHVNEIIEVTKDNDLKLHKSTADIPEIVTRTINSWGDSWGDKFFIVDSTYSYQPEDFKKWGPKRELISIFKNKNHFIMTYQHSGRGRHTHIMYFQFLDNKVKEFWVGFGNVTGHDMDNIQGIRTWLETRTSELQTNMVDF